MENKAEEGELVDSRNSNDRFTDDELAIAKSVDLCAVAESLGYTVKRIGKYHTIKEMDLQVVQGIGDTKAIALQAAIELGKRYSLENMAERPDMGSSLAIYNFLLPHVRDLEVEECHLLLMNQNFKLIKHVPMSHGGLTETAVDVRRIMREAVLNNATILALAHNHPSNSPHPSRADDMLTKSVKEACDIMRIFFMDHVIIADGCYYSYHDRGKMGL